MTHSSVPGQSVTGNSPVLAGYDGATTLKCVLNVTPAAQDTVPMLGITLLDSPDGQKWNTITRQDVYITSQFADQLRDAWPTGEISPPFTIDARTASK